MRIISGQIYTLDVTIFTYESYDGMRTNLVPVQLARL